MTWKKDRALTPGELEFHLTGLRASQGERPEGAPDEARIQHRLDKLRERRPR